MAQAVRIAGPLAFIDRAVGRVAADPRELGDVVLARKDAPTSYHLSVALDDALQRVMLVTRGTDLFHATPVHRLLQVLLGLPEPEYHHHRLLTDARGRSAERRVGKECVSECRACGSTDI